MDSINKIELKVEVTNQQELESKLQSTLNSLESKFKIKVKFDNIDTSSLSKISSEIEKVQKSIGNIKFNNLKVENPYKDIDKNINSDSFNKINSNIKTTSQSIENLQNQIQKVNDNISFKNLMNSLKEQNNSVKEQLNYVKKLNSELEKGLREDEQAAQRTANAVNKQISTITKGIEDMRNKINSIETKSGKSSALFKWDDSSLKRYEQEVESLQKTLSNLKSTKTPLSSAEFDKVKNSISTAKSSLKDFESGLKETGNEGTNLGTKLNNVFNSGLIFTAAQRSLDAFISKMKEGIDYVMEFDKRLTNMKMITGQNEQQILKTMEGYKKIAEELHVTNSEMLAGMEEVTRAGYDQSTGQKVIEAATMGAKISGQTIETVTQQLISLKNAFNLTGDDMSKVVDMISNMDNHSASSFADIAGALQRVAYSAQQAGTPLDKLISYITTISEKTRKPAEEIGNALRTVYARYSNIKLGNLDEDGKSINDTEKAMKRIGINIRKNKGEFKDFDEVLSEFIEKYKSGQLSQVDYLAGIQSLAGTRQREVLMALIENVDTLNQHTQELTNSTGSAKKMMEEAYSNSIEAKVNDLKRAFENLYEKVIDSGVIKSVLEGLTKAVEKFGNTKSIIIGVVDAFAILKGQQISSAINGLISSLKGLSGLSGIFTGLGGFFKANWFTLITLGVTAIIAAYDKWKSKSKDLKKEIEELDKEIEEHKKQTQELKDDFKIYSELKEKANLTKEETEKLNNVRNDIAKKHPELVKAWTAEGQAILKEKDAIQQVIDKMDEKTRKLQEQKKENQLQLTQQSVNKKQSAEKKLNNAQKDLEEAYKTGDQTGIPHNSWKYQGQKEKIEKFSKELEKANKELDENINKIKSSDASYAKLGENFKRLADGHLSRVVEEFKAGKISGEEFAKKLNGISSALASDEVQKAYTKFANLSKKLKEGTGNTKDAHKAYEELVSVLKKLGLSEEEINKYMAESEEAQKKQEAALKKSKKAFEEQKKAAMDAAEKAKWSSSQQKEASEESAKAHQKEAEEHKKSENKKTQNTQNGTKNRNMLIDAEVTENEGKYQRDSENQNASEQQKTTNSQNAQNKVLSIWDIMIGALNGTYNTDSQNFANEQGKKPGSAQESRTGVEGAFSGLVGVLSGIYSNDESNFSTSCNNKVSEAQGAAGLISNAFSSALSWVGSKIANLVTSAGEIIPGGEGGFLGGGSNGSVQAKNFAPSGGQSGQGKKSFIGGN